MSIIGAAPVKLTDVTDYVFRGLEFESLERLHVEDGEQIRVTSVIDSERGRYSYELVCEPDWTFRAIRIEAAARRAGPHHRVRRQGRVDRRRRMAQRPRRVHRRRPGRDPVHEHAADPAARPRDRRGGRPARRVGRLPEPRGHGRPPALHAARPRPLPLRLARQRLHRRPRPSMTTASCSTTRSCSSGCDQTILITGGTGRLGRHVVDALRSRGHDVRILSRRPGDGHIVGDLATGAGLPRGPRRRRHGRAPRDVAQQGHRSDPTASGCDGRVRCAPDLHLDRGRRSHPVPVLPRQGRERAGDRGVGRAVHDHPGDAVPRLRP